MKTANSRQELLAKKEVLEAAKVQLKKEFFGIDNIIEGVIEDLSSWFLFPSYQERPLVINLWGMTGTGKTSLIKRLSELIDFHQKFFHFEMSKTENRNRVQESLEEIFNYHNSKPTIMVFDEFQHLRSKDERGWYVQNDLSQIIWKILDSGKFDIVDYDHRKEQLIDHFKLLKRAVESGVKVKSGVITYKRNVFLDILGTETEGEYFSHRRRNRKVKEPKEGENLNFINDEIIDDLKDCLASKALTKSVLRKKFNELNEKETINYFKALLEEILAPKEVDCSKSVVFVVGNLDSAYPMSGELNPDIDADFMYRKSLEINISEIKDSLSEFLRLEQISRLGNIHHIYPSLSKRSYESIIDKELHFFSDKIKQGNGVKVSFTEATKALVYSEGVYPTQGTRPLLSTIYKVIRGKLGEVLGEAAIKNWTSLNQVNWDTDEDGFFITYKSASKVLGTKRVKVEKSLEKIRKENDGEKRVIVATHEAGHALVHRVLFGESPEVIFSSTASSTTGGFVLADETKVYSRNVGIKKLAVLLAGYCAEKEVFGPDSITHGAGNDLFKADQLAVRMVASWSFQKFRRSTVYTDVVISRDDRNQHIEHNEILDEAFTIADAILKKYEKAFLALSNQLMKQRMMVKEEVENLITANAPGLENDGLKAHKKGYYINKFQQALGGKVK